jgi:hypothetical protein
MAGHEPDASACLLRIEPLHVSSACWSTVPQQLLIWPYFALENSPVNPPNEFGSPEHEIDAP